jgi:Holliday junction resolvase RusA-like endonuclease
MYDPTRSKEYKRFVAYTIKRDKCCPKTPITGPVTMELYFYMQRPKSLAKSIKHHVKRPDADNLAKAVIDALSGIVIKDDSQITELLVQKMYAEDKIGVEIQIS